MFIYNRSCGEPQTPCFPFVNHLIIDSISSTDPVLQIFASVLFLSFLFFRGKGEPVTELSWSSCRQLLYQSMATILAHTGFECANESVLETLTDIAHEYCLKFTKLLRFAVDREARLGHTPFPDVMEQVFHEVGIGSVLSLQKFWQHRIKDYHSYMLQVRRAWGTWRHRKCTPGTVAYSWVLLRGKLHGKPAGCGKESSREREQELYDWKTEPLICLPSETTKDALLVAYLNLRRVPQLLNYPVKITK